MLTEWIEIDHLQCEIRRVEGFDVQLSNYAGQELNCDSDSFHALHYDLWSKAAPGKMTVAGWQENRIAKWRSDIEVTIVDLHGKPYSGSTMLADIRQVYGKKLWRPVWPATYTLFFCFKFRDYSAALRLKERLVDDEYEVKYKEQGLMLWKHHLVVGRIQQVRVPDFRFFHWRDKFVALADKHTGILEYSFQNDYRFTLGED